MTPLRIFIGFDMVESVSWHVLTHSILSRSSLPVSFIPIKRSLLKSAHNRSLDPKQSNEFSFTRFLVPWLSNYEGLSVFMDTDMLVTTDICRLFELWDPAAAVQVVKHDYTPVSDKKYLGNVQYPYPKKNWSSVMLFNNAKCKALSPGYVNQASGLQLHQFKWLESEDLIGELPASWNHLVGEYPMAETTPNLIHWTNYGPWLKGYEHTDYADLWYAEKQAMLNAKQDV